MIIIFSEESYMKKFAETVMALGRLIKWVIILALFALFVLSQVAIAANLFKGAVPEFYSAIEGFLRWLF